jgi:outer membrane protein OmpA-like peptidoglycan-associated protein
MSPFAPGLRAEGPSTSVLRPSRVPSGVRAQRALAVAPTSDPLEHEAERMARTMTAPGGEHQLAQRSVHAPSTISVGPVLVARQGLDDDPAVPEMDRAEVSVIWFPLDSDEPRNDAQVSSDEHFELALARIAQHAERTGDAQRILVHGYASTEGSEGHNLDLAGRRSIRVKNLLVDAGVPSGRIVVLAHGRDETWPTLEWNRRVEIELTPVVATLEAEPVQVLAPYCDCPPETEVDYADDTIAYIKSIAPEIAAAAAARGVSPLAIAGAIADEYDAHGLVDLGQDAVVPRLLEWMIDIDRFLDIEPQDLEPIVGEDLGEKGAKLLNTLENDIGPANIKVRTALALVEAGAITVPGSPSGNPQVSVIIDFLMTDPGTVETTGAVIGQAQQLFGPFLGDHGDPVRDAVLMEYFKQGDTYYDRFLEAHGMDPAHVPCPGLDGCQFLHNYDRLERALAPLP